MDWISGWSKRIKLTIDGSKVGSDLTNFPVLVNLDATCSGVFNELGNNNKRIAFISPTTHEQYFCEIEGWDSLNKSAQLWIKIPTVVSGTSTEFYMLYDNNASDNINYIGDTASTVAQNVWESDYVSVHHLSQDPAIGGACLLDSTSGNHDGAPVNTITQVDGSISKAVDFQGDNDSVSIPNSNSYDIAELTVSHFVYSDHTVTKQEEGLVQRRSQFCTRFGAGDGTGNIWAFTIKDIGGTWRTATCSTKIPILGWHELSLTCNNTSHVVDFYVDGIYVSSGSITNAMIMNDGPIVLGYSGYSDWYVDGKMDEVRISKTIRSAAWIKTEHHANVDTLITKSQEEIQPTGELGYQNKIKLSIPYSYIDNSLYNFPILVNLSSSSGLNNEDITEVFTHLGSTVNRKKIAITDYTGIGQCYVEIERWSQAEHSAQLWIKVPEISSTSDTTLYLYYDKTKSDNTLFVGDTSSMPAQNVWDDDFTVVYHMSQDPSAGTLLDSSKNEKHGSYSEGMNSGNLVDGSIAKALSFDGSTNYVDLPIFPSYAAGFSLSIEIKNDGMLSSEDIWFFNNYGGNTNHIILANKAAGNFSIYFDDDTTGGWYDFTHSIEDAVDYIQLDVVYESGGQFYLYYNGELNNSGVHTYGDPDLTERSFYIGQVRNDAFDYGLKGFADEVRFSTINRQPHWIAATYKSNTDNLISYTTTKQTSWLETYEGGTLSPWAKRIKLEIDNTKVDSHLVDFPVLINLSENSGYNGRDVTNILTYLITNKYKLALTIDDGVTQLPVEIEHWNTDTGSKSLPFASRNLGSKNNNSSGLSLFNEPIDNGTYYTFDGATNGLFNSTYVGETSEEVCLIRLRIHNKNKGSIQTIWKDGGSSNGVGVGIDASGNLGIFGVNNTTPADPITIPSTNYENNVWYDVFFTRDRVSIVNSNTGILIDTAIGDCITADGTANESIGYCTYQSPISLNTGSDIDFFEGDIDFIEVYIEGNLVAPSTNPNNTTQLWTKVPNITTEEKTILYLYYDENKSDNIEYIGDMASSVSCSVWDDNFVFVSHQANSPSGYILESTIYSNHGISYGSMTSNDVINILIGKGLRYDGTDDYTNHGYDAAHNITDTLTLEVSFTPNILLNDTTEIACLVTRQAPSSDSYTLIINSSGLLQLGSSGGNIQSTKASWTADQNFIVTGTYNSTGLLGDLFVDGVKETLSIDNYDSMSGSVNEVKVGGGNSGEEFNGIISEIRISNIVRSDSWIATTYHNNTDALIFYNTAETYIAPETEPNYFYHGYIKEYNSPVARKVSLYDSTTGLLIDSTTSESASGYYLLETPNNTEHFIIVLDDDLGEVFVPLIQDKLLPNGI